MVALIAIMAQIGCYVPASSVKLGILDSILTRMGASDDLARGRSTFMVEMTETKEIIDSASSKSLVILDELGRGTSTFDGMAIASAVLHHLVQSTICKTLFITHYPSVAEAFGKHFIADVQNLHMGYLADSRINGVREITFLYRLAPGIAKESFGIECGRLAGLPEELLLNASRKASEMQELVNKRIARNRTRKVMEILAQGLNSSESSIIIQLWDMVKSMNINP
ncbi:Mismatch repair protein msh3 [Stygiomarasmius scandens]|uniref:MutS protein homolog 3 n=1 Tax=Marasmiellus scandens TaxID=2682957 RepID=A0ABR1JXM0_9AGAR